MCIPRSNLGLSLISGRDLHTRCFYSCTAAVFVSVKMICILCGCAAARFISAKDVLFDGCVAASLSL